MIDNLTDSPLLKNINPTKLRIINEIREESKKHSIDELIPQILQINSELSKRSMNFTKEETKLLMQVLEESMTPAEKSKFNMIKEFI